MQAHLRIHALHLLNIEETAQLRDPAFYVPPSDEDIKAFDKRLPGCIEITPGKFRLDLTRSRNTLFNRCAKGVFARDFIHKVTQDKWYSFPPILDKYLDLDYVQHTFHGQMKHLIKVYKSRDATVIEERLRMVAYQGRKRTVWQVLLEELSAI